MRKENTECVLGTYLESVTGLDSDTEG